MIDLNTLMDMIGTSPVCELGYTGCEGIAVEHGVHPTGVALGEEDEWMIVWYCYPCAWSAAQDS